MAITLATGRASVLAGLRQRLIDDLQTFLTAVETDGGLTLPMPAADDIRIQDWPEPGTAEEQRTRERPLILIEAADEDDSMSPVGVSQRITRWTLGVRAYVKGTRVPAESDRQAQRYGLALRQALDYIGDNPGIDGCVHLRTDGEGDISRVKDNDTTGDTDRTVDVYSELWIESLRATA